jgi:pyridoxamine 5'-phosphate oxidase
MKEKDVVVSDLVTATPANSDFTEASEPFSLFEAWFAESAKSEINDPNAMALATADVSGVPNVRMVLLKGLDPAEHTPRGFVFYTNTSSTKGRELLTNPNAALLFHWKSLRRQVRIKGAITQVSAAEADSYYATRPKGSRIGAWASQQSQPLPNRAVLEQAVTDFEAQYPSDNIPRPPNWTGFRLTPREIEFWHDRPYRLHDRIVFRRDAPTKTWSKTRLYP